MGFSFNIRSILKRIARLLADNAVFLFPSALELPIQQQRIDVIQGRIHALAWLLLISVPAWSLLDAVSFPEDLFVPILEARLLAGAAFGLFLFINDLFKKNGIRNLALVYIQLAILFVIPTLLYVFCYRLPDRLLDTTSFEDAVKSTYYFLPFVILGCLGFFPLALLESLSIVTPFLAAFYLTTSTDAPFVWSSDMGMGWVMVVMAVVAVIISQSQLRMLVRLIGLSSYDALTDCLGRRSGEEILRSLWHYSVRRKSPLSIAFLDLDHFKMVNDCFGHHIGDAVLVETTASIRNALRKSDFVIRWGGEEFLIILPDATIENAIQILTRMTEKGLSTRPDGSKQTVSIGIAERINEGAEEKDTLIQIADNRLYEAKIAGRCRAVGARTIVLR